MSWPSLMNGNLSDRISSDPVPIRGEWTEAYIIDPITGLIAFPSFLEAFSQLFIELMQTYGSIGLAIGDVDHLKTYVESANRNNPLLFGHLAGNAFMSTLGKISLSVFKHMLFPWCCMATFGGDEIIIACAGNSRSEFISSVRLLSLELATGLPRTVSFAQGWFTVSLDEHFCTLDIESEEATALCLSSIALVDRALFTCKNQRHRKPSDGMPLVRHMRTRWLKNKQWSLGKWP